MTKIGPAYDPFATNALTWSPRRGAGPLCTSCDVRITAGHRYYEVAGQVGLIHYCCVERPVVASKPVVATARSSSPRREQRAAQTKRARMTKTPSNLSLNTAASAIYGCRPHAAKGSTIVKAMVDSGFRRSEVVAALATLTERGVIERHGSRAFSYTTVATFVTFQSWTADTFGLCHGTDYEHRLYGLAVSDMGRLLREDGEFVLGQPRKMLIVHHVDCHVGYTGGVVALMERGFVQVSTYSDGEGHSVGRWEQALPHSPPRRRR